MFARLFAVALIIAAGPAFAGSVGQPQRGDKIGVGQIAATPMDADGDAEARDDPFHAMFMTWRKLDSVSSQQEVIAVPSTKPVNMATFTSGYGVRTDPFRRSAAMHAGIDLAAPAGTAIYATADGVIDNAGWSGGYGNLVEIDHGKGIQTRFGHLSKVLVHPGQHVARGQLIALMGSTGRSTGSHLHYEVRIDGHAVNPVPFLQAADYVTAMEARSSAQIALGGPDDVNDLD